MHLLQIWDQLKTAVKKVRNRFRDSLAEASLLADSASNAEEPLLCRLEGRESCQTVACI